MDNMLDEKTVEIAQELTKDNHFPFTQNEYIVYKRRYLDGKTLEEVGDELYCTRERVRQIEEKFLEKLRFCAVFDLKYVFKTVDERAFMLNDKVKLDKALFKIRCSLNSDNKGKLVLTEERNDGKTYKSSFEWEIKNAIENHPNRLYHLVNDYGLEVILK